MAKYYLKRWGGPGVVGTLRPSRFDGNSPNLARHVESLFYGQDQVVGSSRRILAHTGLNGVNDYWSNQATDSAKAQLQERTMLSTSVRLTPGCFPKISVLYSPSGENRNNVVFLYDVGNEGECRVDLTFHGNSLTSTQEVNIPLDGSTDDDGGEDTSEGGRFRQLRRREVGPIFPIGSDATATYNDYCKGVPTLDITITAVTQARIKHVIVYEEPIQAVMEAEDSFDEWTSHCYTKPRPKWAYEEADTDATDGDPRKGTFMLASVNENQRSRMGPMLFHWSAWNDAEGGIGNGAQLASAGTRGVKLNIGGYARRFAENNPHRLHGRYVTIPVYVTTWGGSSGDAFHWLRVQTSYYSYVDAPVRIGVSTTYGHLQVALSPEQDTYAQIYSSFSNGSSPYDILGVTIEMAGAVTPQDWGGPHPGGNEPLYKGEFP